MANPLMTIFGKSNDPSTSLSQYSLGQKQALIDALKQNVLNPQPMQQYGPVAARISPVSTAAQIIGAMLAKRQQNQLNQQAADLQQKQLQSYYQMAGGGQQNPQPAQPQQNPQDQGPQASIQQTPKIADYFNNPQQSQPQVQTNAAQPTPQPSQPDPNATRDPAWVTPANPGGFNPGIYARAKMQMDPKDFNSQFFEPFVKPVEMQHTKDDLFSFDPRSGSYYAAGDQSKTPLTSKQMQEIRDNSRPDKFQHIGAGIMMDPTTGTGFVMDEKGNKKQLSSQQISDRLSQFAGNKAVATTNAKNNPGNQDDDVVQSWAQNVLNGNATMQQVPMSHRDAVSKYLTKMSTDAYSPVASSRFSAAANRIATNYIHLPQYQLTANGMPYLQRIDAALKTPGSVSDEDLLDSLIKLNTGGNAVTEAQVNLITHGKSFSDTINTIGNKLKNGGVLSDNQRKDIAELSKAIYENYRKGYQPVYDQVTSQLKASGIPKAFWGIPDLNSLSEKAGLGSIPGNDKTSNALPTTNAKGWVLHQDAQGNKAYVSPDGKQYEQVQ